jgi:hypothetical protein
MCGWGTTIFAINPIALDIISCKIHTIMAEAELSSLSIDKSAFSVRNTFDDADDKQYWLAQTPYARLRHIEYLRQINYGHRATARLQRVLEITQAE